MKNFLVHTDEVKQEMFESIGVAGIEDLFSQIPEKARMTSLDLGKALSEAETQRRIKALSKKNNTDYVSFLGAGTYNKFVPACISQVANRFELAWIFQMPQCMMRQRLVLKVYLWQSECLKRIKFSFQIV